MNGYYKLIRELLLQNGWGLDRQKGSHEIWIKLDCIPVTLSTNCKSKFLANKIIKDAGIKHKF